MLKDKIEQVLKTLTYREREIIKLRYGIGDGYTYTLEEVGRIFKVTRERVRQVEAKAIRKLQHPVRARKLEGFLPGGVAAVGTKSLISREADRMIRLACFTDPRPKAAGPRGGPDAQVCTRRIPQREGRTARTCPNARKRPRCLSRSSHRAAWICGSAESLRVRPADVRRTVRRNRRRLGPSRDGRLRLEL